MWGLDGESCGRVEMREVMTAGGCDIDDISICERMANIEVLSLSVNRVETLQPLRNCSRLVELYLRKNNIQSFTEFEHLKDLRNLRVLWIDENPCTKTGDYRHRILRLLPQLTKLDDRPVTLDDHMEAQQDDSAPECDMHASMISIHSARSSRSSVTVHDAMTQSLYGRAIVDTVMQPQMVSYGDASDEERLPPPRDPQSFRESLRGSRMSLMSQSMHPSLMTQSIYEPAHEERGDDEWGDFRFVSLTLPMLSYSNQLSMARPPSICCA
ncbi:leucine Rich repeat-containing domain protein [Oesophagostomum dentatum]|uniref:Leucine Rich repeat-containing domain protein n=1 Tax=Oesophagostomum dentatum TaxID=61180 RepID=A0A0B1T4R0_OESDE|nr:leucine Rich repeat-containing domain protein [Oesophagostomum dentatum]